MALSRRRKPCHRASGCIFVPQCGGFRGSCRRLAIYDRHCHPSFIRNGGTVCPRWPYREKSLIGEPELFKTALKRHLDKGYPSPRHVPLQRKQSSRRQEGSFLPQQHSCTGVRSEDHPTRLQSDLCSRKRIGEGYHGSGRIPSQARAGSGGVLRRWRDVTFRDRRSATPHSGDPG